MEVELGRRLQWHLWLANDNVSGTLCVGGIITRISNFFKINLNNIPSLPPSYLDENLLRNSRQFKVVRNIWVWKDKVGDEDVDEELE